MTSDLIRMASVSLLLLLCTLCLAYGESIKSINKTAVPHVVHSTIATNVIKPSVVKSSTVKPPSPIHSKTVSSPIKSQTSVHSVQPFTSHSKSIQPSKSTSVRPSASSTAPPPTAPPTTAPLPPKKARGFNVTNDNSTVCMRMKAVISLNVTYFTKDKKTSQKMIYIDESTKNVKVSGTCETNTRSMWISIKNEVMIMLNFTKVGAGLLSGSQRWEERDLAAFVVTKTFSKSNGTEIIVTSNSSHFGSGMNSYYKCDSGLGFKVDKINFDFSKLEVQPFADSSNEGFGEGGEMCEGDRKPNPKPTDAPDNDIVPIAVGCALAGLVVIVLIAYIIGRRRTHKGYQQV